MGALTLGIVLPAGPSTPPGRALSADGRWAEVELRTAGDLREAARALGMTCEITAVPAFSDCEDFSREAVRTLLSRRLRRADVVQIVAHDRLGGSGALHAMARACGLPVLGPSARAIGAAFDKLRAREHLRRHNLPVPQTLALDDAAAGDERGLGWPCVVKPRRGAAGRGVRRLHTPAEITDEITRAGEDELAPRLLERAYQGTEVSVVLVDGEVLGTAQIERGPDKTAMICPAQLDGIRRVGVENLARQACAALELDAGAVRVDMIVADRDNELILEVEPLPPLHRESVVARVARAAGLSYPRLVAQVLGTSLLERSSTLPVSHRAHAPL